MSTARIPALAMTLAACGALAGSSPATAQPPVCDDWQEDLAVVFPDRVARGTPGEIVITRKADTSASITQLVTQQGEGPVTTVPVPEPGAPTRLPVAAVQGVMHMAVSWQQDEERVFACAGTATAIAKVTPSRRVLVRYAALMRPALRAWSAEARPAVRYLERGQAVLRGARASDLESVARAASRAGMTIAPAAPILRGATSTFAQRAKRIPPPAGMAKLQRGISKDFARLARGVEVTANVLGRVRSPLDLITAGQAIEKITFGSVGQKWGAEMAANYTAAGLQAPRWLIKMASD
jgi:hypothetical protein